MKQNIVLLMLSISSIAYSQQDTVRNGIIWEMDADWQQIKEKAIKENKYIFVDCMASWCGPCKKMDKNVYSLSEVGDYFNKKFISVKVQMDSTNKDSREIKRWYNDAKLIRNMYNISGFPTYLFFSPQGDLIHRGLGYKRFDNLLLLAKEAIDTTKQYCRLIKSYEEGKRDYKTMPYLAKTAKMLNELNLSKSIAADYIHNYLLRLSTSELLKKDNIEFIISFIQTVTSKDRGFDLFYRFSKDVDSIMDNKGLSITVVDAIITREMISPAIHKVKHGHVGWRRLFIDIRKKYDYQYADRNVLSSKVSWFFEKKKWNKFTKCLVMKVEKYGVGYNSVEWKLNDNAFYVFLYSNKKRELNTALSWIQQAVDKNPEQHPNMIDTKANILYKLGKKQEAIELQSMAVQIEAENSRNSNRLPDKAYEQNLVKMCNNIPTWPQE